MSARNRKAAKAARRWARQVDDVRVAYQQVDRKVGRLVPDEVPFGWNRATRRMRRYRPGLYAQTRGMKGGLDG